ncbi:MAG: transglutaminase domain-containing protein [Anaerolineae bacterium]|nr:transglutaminase domain-containing protein [Anaerolineae bacterium]
MTRAIRVMIYVALIVTSSSGIFFLLPSGVTYRVTERYTFSSDQADNQIWLAVMLPKDNAYQHVENVQIGWEGDIFRENYREAEVIRLEGETAEKGREAILEYDVTLLQGRVSWKAEVRMQDTMSQENIESDAAILANKAKEICGTEPERTAYKTYTFTADHLSWPEGNRTEADQSALVAYESRVGACGEFANLMTALNRACGNPAKSVTGLSMPTFLPPMMSQETTWLHPGAAHAWVEVYDNGVWKVADPSRASRMPLDSLWFGRIHGQYLSYGEMGAHAQIYASMLAWGDQKGEIIGAMSAPLRFVAASEDRENMTVTPTVRVQKVSDVRWFTAGGLCLAVIVASGIIESRMRQKEKTVNAG